MATFRYFNPRTFTYARCNWVRVNYPLPGVSQVLCHVPRDKITKVIPMFSRISFLMVPFTGESFSLKFKMAPENRKWFYLGTCGCILTIFETIIMFSWSANWMPQLSLRPEFILMSHFKMVAEKHQNHRPTESNMRTQWMLCAKMKVLLVCGRNFDRWIGSKF